jgi:hypothetical protein
MKEDVFSLVIGLIIIAILAFTAGMAVGDGFKTDSVRKELIEKKMGQYVADPVTGKTHFESQFKFAK